MKIICEKHFTAAEYFSKELGEYVCNKCLVESQGLTAIDEQTKKYMCDFDEIRKNTMESILKNRKNVNTMLEWKDSIRHELMVVKEEFSKAIDQYTDKFVESLREIDQSSELALFQGEDKRQSMQLLEMEKKFESVE